MHKMCLLLGLLLPVNFALAWGVAGHEAIGIIAEQNLSPQTKAKVSALLEKGEDLAKASLYPDEVKHTSGWGHTRPYHYVSIPDGDTYFNALEDLSEKDKSYGDIGRALAQSEVILRDPKASTQAKRYALRFIVHFAGDIHQPLHAGIAEDKGGNLVEMIWQNKKTNLHAVWDFSIIDMFIDPNFIGGEKTTPLRGEDYVKRLRKPSQKEIAEWQKSFFMTWIDESQAHRTVTYEKVNGTNKAYYTKNIDLVNERVLQAGVRLGAWLNAIFENRPFFSAETQKALHQMDEILGEEASYGSIVLAPKAVSTLNFRDELNLKSIDHCNHKH